jgi:dipeptidyl aminopeptidase/acylaminoacyl peptidase
MPITASYGSWKSPITPDVVISDSISLEQIALDGADIYWIEGRPKEQGRSVIVRRAPDGIISDAIPSAFNARNMVHEYGGGNLLVVNGEIFFPNFTDQRLYRCRADQEPRALTSEGPFCYADMIMDRNRDRLICVREDHTIDTPRDVVNTLVSVDLRSGEARVLVSGNDFYSSPRLSPDGKRLAWLTWHHPNMPWDGTELFVGEIDADGSIGRAEKIAGGDRESVFQPEWSPDGSLYFVNEPTGWWNIYRWRNGSVENMTPMQAEFGLPQWIFGRSSYGVESAGQLICAYKQNGKWNLARLNTTTKALMPIDLPYAEIDQVCAARGMAVIEGGSPTEPWSYVSIDLESGKRTVLRSSLKTIVDAGYLSVPKMIEFPTENNLTAHGYYYPPANKDFSAPADEKPPLMVISHGGPTSSTNTALAYRIQYWTSRGFAVLDVNYGGSTGYGRAYRERLNGQWGVVDMNDCVNGALYLVRQGLADQNRLAIRGGSAGGYTTLCALTFRDVFKAGASHFGISELEVFTKDTHKFESRYMDSLIGPYPEKKDVYFQRSPINFIDNISCPIILFQGLDDKVVPHNQADLIYEAVLHKEMPVAYLKFEGEGHGFRKAENIKRAYEAELYFYARIFGFALADPVEPVEIQNL